MNKVITIAENLSIFEILQKLYVGLEDFENPDKIYIKNNTLDDYYISVSVSTAGINGIRSIASLNDFDQKITKVKKFELDYEFIVVKTEKTQDNEVLMSTMTLLEVIIMSNISEDIKKLWNFDQPIFTVYSIEEE